MRSSLLEHAERQLDSIRFTLTPRLSDSYAAAAQPQTSESAEGASTEGQGQLARATSDGGPPPRSGGLFGPSGKRYAEAGSKAWTIGGLYANNFNQAHDANLHVDFSYFLADRLEFAVELAGWYFNQPDRASGSGSSSSRTSTGGISGSMIFRWHFYQTEDRDWTLFADAGIGLLGAFEDVPSGGTEFNFLPRFGLGLTKALGDDTTGQAPRLMIGVRWHHISNARINGDDRNPARDAVAGYIGVVFPF